MASPKGASGEEGFFMSRKILIALISAVALAAMAFAEPVGAATHEGHHHHSQQPDAKRARRRTVRKRVRAARHRAKARRKTGQAAAVYSCPMHPDIREKASGTCPKCLMDLVREGGAAGAQQ